MLCDYGCIACLLECMNSSCNVRLKDEGLVRQGRQINFLVTAANQLLPVYCCTGFSFYGDIKSLTFDSSGTEAHPVRVPYCSSASSHVPLPVSRYLGCPWDPSSRLLWFLILCWEILNRNFTGILQEIHQQEASHNSCATAYVPAIALP